MDNFDTSSADIPSFKLEATASNSSRLKCKLCLKGTKKLDFLTINLVPTAYNCPAESQSGFFTSRNAMVSIQTQ